MVWIAAIALFCILPAESLATESATMTFHKASKSGSDTVTIRYKQQMPTGKWVNKLFVAVIPINKGTDKDSKAETIANTIKTQLKMLAERPFSIASNGNSVNITASSGFTIAKTTATNNSGQVGNEGTMALGFSEEFFVEIILSDYAKGYTEEGYPAILHVGLVDKGDAVVFTYGKNPEDMLNEMMIILQTFDIPAQVIDNKLYFKGRGVVRWGCNDAWLGQKISVLDLSEVDIPTLQEDNEDVK